MSQPRRVFSSEFKREAVELAAKSGKPLRELERELGLSDGLLKQWVRKAQKDGPEAFPGHGRLKSDDEELRRLRRENEILRQERDILKKAIAIFTQEPKRSMPL
jgi:transposase